MSKGLVIIGYQGIGKSSLAGWSKYVTEFVADQVQFLTPRNQQTTDAGSTPGNDEFAEAPEGDSDDLPF